jgi:hypothetical protein
MIEWYLLDHVSQYFGEVQDVPLDDYTSIFTRSQREVQWGAQIDLVVTINEFNKIVLESWAYDLGLPDVGDTLAYDAWFRIPIHLKDLAWAYRKG